MNGTVLMEFALLFLDLGIGIGIGLLFDCYRLLRRLLRPGRLASQLADFCFWICCTALTFRVFFMVTGGEVNPYNLLIIPAGTALYLKLASPALQRPLLVILIQLDHLLSFLSKILRLAAWLLWQAVLLPFRAAWWLAQTCLQVLIVLLRLLLLPGRLLLQWLWREWREALRRFGRWLRHFLHRR